MEKKIYGVVYGLIDGTNDFEYIGQTTKTAEERFKEHMYSPHYIGNAIRKHGAENFVIAILKVCYSKAELDFLEKHFIKSRNTMSHNGYNLTEGGEGVAGFTPSPKTCSKISITHRRNTPFKNLVYEISKNNLSYRALARLMGLCSTSISLKMRGEQNFTAAQVAKLVEIFGKPADYLMQRDDTE